MAFNCLSGRCGYFWEAGGSYATTILPKDHQEAQNTLRFIHANPKVVGLKKEFVIPIATMGTAVVWRPMVLVSGIQVFFRFHQHSRNAPSVMGGFEISIAITRKVL